MSWAGFQAFRAAVGAFWWRQRWALLAGLVGLAVLVHGLWAIAAVGGVAGGLLLGMTLAPVLLAGGLLLTVGGLLVFGVGVGGLAEGRGLGGLVFVGAGLVALALGVLDLLVGLASVVAMLVFMLSPSLGL